MIAVDIGNTKTAVGFFRDAELIHHERFPTDSNPSLDTILERLRTFSSTIDLPLASLGPMVLASVVPSVNAAWLALRRDMDIHVVSPTSPLSYRIALEKPETLGSDRIADLEGAVSFFGAPVIVVDAGTATTVNVVNRSREFLGGAIAPGLTISLEALFARAARVPNVSILPPERVIGQSTEEALYSGSYYGHAALIQGLVAKMKGELGEPEAKVVFSGGSIPHLERYLGSDIKYEPLLTLKGLHLIHLHLQKGKN